MGNTRIQVTKRKCSKSLLLFLVFGILLGCGDAKDLIDLGLDPPERKPIDISRTGVNNFFNDSSFGSTEAQFSEIRDTLGLRFVRVLFAWTNDVQRRPSSTVSFALFDQIVSSIPPGVDILVVVAHSPDWMADSSNWTRGNPRVTWVEEWLTPLVNRYRGVPGIIGWEVWNEPDRTLFAGDAALGLEDPQNYLELLALSSARIRASDPGKLVVIAATESIQQQFPTRLNYNKELQNFGAEDLVDVWNVHYYGESFESVVTDNGVKDFLNSLRRPIWITESGEQGPNKQLPYVETAWPFLREEIPGIDRIYYYEFGSTAPLEANYGLRTGDAAFPVSDLYIHFRDNAG